MGNGKSTTGNQLIRQALKEKNLKPKKNCQEFYANKSLEAVTRKVEVKELEDINFIDSPGFNDPNKERSDNIIFADIVETVHQIGSE